MQLAAVHSQYEFMIKSVSPTLVGYHCSIIARCEFKPGVGAPHGVLPATALVRGKSLLGLLRQLHPRTAVDLGCAMLALAGMSSLLAWLAHCRRATSSST